jgi:CubicO group peptidase (beta-lactamase class C family)
VELVRGVAGPGLPGLAIGIYRDGHLIEHAEAGEASVEFSVPIDVGTRFEIASTSKHFTAAAVLLLCRDGILSLDDDIRAHLPELSLGEAVTVAQCLEHTGGLREWLSSADIAGLPMTRVTQDQALAFVSGFTTLNFAPGTEFAYSNTGYILAASIVEHISGRTLGEFAEERIFAPLGMTQTFFREDSRAVIPRFAYGYMRDGRAVARADTEECAVGDGGLVTSVADLASWFGFLQDGRVLGADIRDGLLQRSVLADGTEHPYARGLYHVDIAGRHAFGHAGGAQGYRSQLLFVPEENLGVAVLTNSSALDPVVLSAQAIEEALDAPPPECPRFVVVDADSTVPLVGHWIDHRTDDVLTIERADDGRVRSSGTLPDAEFGLAEDGRWHAVGASAPMCLRLDGDRLETASALRPGRDAVYERCEGPDTSSRPPVGVYRSRELGTYAIITEGSVIELGTRFTGRIEAAPDGAFSAPGMTIRRVGDDILISSWGARRIRFERQPGGEGPRGIPAGLKQR